MNNPDLTGIGMTSQRTRSRLIDRLRDQGIADEAVLSVMASVPRHIFVDEALAHRAYEDTALPIGFNQTISQPYIVARMTEVLLSPDSFKTEGSSKTEGSLKTEEPVKLQGPVKNVLEVGTGSGYQTAVLAALVDKVYSVERIEGLLVKARKRLKLLRIDNTFIKNADGAMGWEEKAPFDSIILTASPREIPAGLIDQLATGGRLIAPLGMSGEQQLVVVTRTHDGTETTVLEKVKFVPLLSGVV